MSERIEIPIQVNLTESGSTVSFQDDGPFKTDFGPVTKVNTSNYEELFNKPKINDRTIIGEKLGADYGLQDKMDVASQAEVEAILYID